MAMLAYRSEVEDVPAAGELGTVKEELEFRDVYYSGQQWRGQKHNIQTHLSPVQPFAGQYPAGWQRDQVGHEELADTANSDIAQECCQ